MIEFRRKVTIENRTFPVTIDTATRRIEQMISEQMIIAAGRERLSCGKIF